MGKIIDAITKANEELVETIRKNLEAAQRQGAGVVEAATAVSETIAPASIRFFERSVEIAQESFEAARGVGEAWLTGNVFGPEGKLSPQVQEATDRYASAFSAFLGEFSALARAVREGNASFVRKLLEAQLATLGSAEDVAKGYERVGEVVVKEWQSASKELSESIPVGGVEPLR